ncbi:hypothetical protein D1178_01495 [Stenotrophomonas maltophilia]|nr:hypothetical protein D1178_01495 [Stenotrophomonas maltophilia]
MPAAGRQPNERWQVDVAVAGQRPALPVHPRHAWMHPRRIPGPSSRSTPCVDEARRRQPPPPAFQ